MNDFVGKIPLESVLMCHGSVKLRPADEINKVSFFFFFYYILSILSITCILFTIFLFMHAIESSNRNDRSIS